MSKIPRLFSKDLESLFSEKTYISIILLQIILFSTARSFTAGVILISDPDKAADIFDLGKMVKFGSTQNNSLVQEFTSRGIETTFFESTEYGIQALEKGQIDLFISIPNNLDQKINSQEKIVIDVYYSGSNQRKDLALLLLKSGIRDFKRHVQNIRYGKEDLLFSMMNAELPEDIGELEMLYTFTIPLLLLFSVIISGSLVIDLVTEEIERKTLRNLIQTSASLREILTSKSILPGIITGIMGIFWITIFAMQGILIQNIFIIVLFLFSLSMIYCSIGLLISSLFKKNKHSQTIYTVVIMVSLLFITGTSTNFHPEFIVASLSMSSSPILYPVIFWVLLSIIVYSLSLFVSPKFFREF